MSFLKKVTLPPFLSKLYPRSLAGQFIWLLLIALLFSQVLTGFILINERKEALTVLNRKGNFSRIISTVRVLEESPQELHKKILHAVSSENIYYWFAKPEQSKVLKSAPLDQQLVEKFKRYGINNLVVLESNQNPDFEHKKYYSKRPNSNRKDNRHSEHKPFEWSQIAIQLKDGRWLNVASRFHISPPLWPLANVVSISITAAFLTFIAIFMIRRITKPLAKLTTAAKQLGCGESVEPLKEAGPEDIKTASIAFNQMNDRLQIYISDRTNMLAAVSHDLRTPITTLRLRTELMDEGPTQEAFLSTLNEMQSITDSTLSFIREEKSTEPSQLIDINALLDTICQDLLIQEKEATLITSEACFYKCRPIALKRAFCNLIENAIRYGIKAEIELSKSESQVSIIIRDEGPGIEESQLEEVFKPFVRLDKSRQQAGGTGLGLAITRSIIQNHGGSIRLINNQGKGLSAEIVLPIV